MNIQHIAHALERMKGALQRRPDLGLHDDAPAHAQWQGGTRIVTRHANGTLATTDMPAEAGGTGDHVSPGWLFRAGVASCALTSIALAAAGEGIALAHLAADVTSRSDSRGLLGIADANGNSIDAAARDLQLTIRIGAPGVAADRLRALVAQGCRCAPVTRTVSQGTPLAVHVEVMSA